MAQFVTVNADGTPVATLLPVLWDGSRVLAHLAKANPQWRSIGPRTTGTDDRQRAGRLYLARLVPSQGGARPGGADLELLGGAPDRHR